MRIARAILPSGDRRYGIVQDGQFQPLAVSPIESGLDALALAGESLPLAEVRLLAPTRPGKIIAIGRNYAAHAAEHGADVPTEPLLFLKPPSAVIGPEETIILPAALSQQVEHEAELAVVIGRRSRHLTRENALDAVFGVTCANDVSARDLQRRDGQWSRAKGFDTFCPLGPWIETELDLGHLDVTCRVQGQVKQHSNTSLMVFDIPTLLAHVSAVMTLEPGDVLLTGTPAGVSPLTSGDWVEVEIEGIGALRNPVA